MSWLVLVFAGLLEVAWAVGLKFHGGKLEALVPTVVFAIASMVLLSVAMKQIPLGTAYAIWTGIGILGTVAVDVILGQSMSAGKWFWVALIVAGIAGLKLSR